MNVLQALLEGINIPRMVKVRQTFPAPVIDDISGELALELDRSGVLEKVNSGMRIAIAVGSRGVAELPTLVAETVKALKSRGADPFIVPAMGSHGGATAEGQQEVLADLGVTESTVGCPIISSMEVTEIGRLPNGLPVYIDRHALGADGIIVINRVKPHTAFRGLCESGLVKMVTIGLGKQKGAESCHAYGFKCMAEHLLAMAKISLANAPILFGIGVVENAYDRIARIAAVPAEELIAKDQQLLVEAKANMAKILFDNIDVLVIDEIGKDISGDGMDPNITGRYPTPYAHGGPVVSKIVVLDLTERTHGNANGMGTADFTTRRLVNKTDFVKTYANGLTSTVVGPTHMPTVLESDYDAIRAAIKTSNARDLEHVRLVWIKNTLHMGEICVSETLLEDAQSTAGVTIIDDPVPMKFDASGNLADRTTK